MPANLYAVLPVIALGLFLSIVLPLTAASDNRKPADWRWPALLAVIFAVWTGYTIGIEGPIGFWPNHTVNAWGNQVWFDLLLALGIGWTLLMPRMRLVGMQPWPWLLFTLTTGSIGLLAALARCLYLEARRPTA